MFCYKVNALPSENLMYQSLIRIDVRIDVLNSWCCCNPATTYPHVKSREQ